MCPIHLPTEAPPPSGFELKVQMLIPSRSLAYSIAKRGRRPFGRADSGSAAGPSHAPGQATRVLERSALLFRTSFRVVALDCAQLTSFASVEIMGHRLHLVS